MQFSEYLAKTIENASEEKRVIDKLAKKYLEQRILDDIEKRAAKNSLQVIIENAIGKGKQILKHYNCPVIPMRGRDVFHFMHEISLIDDARYDALMKAVGFRNSMIHDYMNFKEETLFEVLEKRLYDDVIDFLMLEPNYSDVLIKRIENFSF